MGFVRSAEVKMGSQDMLCVFFETNFKKKIEVFDYKE